MDCPNCGKPMRKVHNYEIYVCKDKDCGNKYVAVPQNIFGVN